METSSSFQLPKKLRLRDQEMSQDPIQLIDHGCEEPNSQVVSHAEENSDKASCTNNHGSSLIRDDSSYFNCYADAVIHKVMIEDHVRTQAYRKAILCNYKSFYKKVVADVGAGTGILSIFCAQAGAQKVYAIEASSIAEDAKEIVKRNGYSDKITVIHGKVEDITLPEKVDVIVSEWMGYMLMYECMLPSVLHARDKWLKPGGIILPQEVKLFISPISDFDDYNDWVGFWKNGKNTYGIDMSSLSQTAERQMQASVHLSCISPTSVQAHASCFSTIDLLTVDPASVYSIKGSFKSSCFGYTDINGFVVWFTAHFPNGITLSTSPYKELTHWEQAIMYVPPVKVHQDTIISGQMSISYCQSYHRFLNVEVEYQVNDGEKVTKKYTLKD